MSTLDPDRPDSQRQAPLPSTQPAPGTPEAADAPFDELLSPLHELHVEAGALFTDFAGWQMPVRYSSDLAEHHAVRSAAGLFDLSHMGEIVVVGPESAQALDYALAGKLSAIAEGQAKYSLLLARDGGILDDLVVYRTGEDRYLVVANAANRELVAEELRDRCSIFDCLVEDESDDIALIALQGPIAEEILRNVEGFDLPGLDGLKYYHSIAADFRGHPVLVARTGYTGEDGFEFYLDPVRAPELWVALIETGGGSGLVPAGLAARDTLRLEAGMALYGHELTAKILPEQAGLGRVVALSKEGDFVGRAAIEEGPAGDARVLVGLVAEGKRAGRAGYPIVLPDGAQVVGEVTSGALSPTLGVPVAMAYVDPDFTAVGTELHLDVRGTRVPASVVALPFYQREDHLVTQPSADLKYTADHEWIAVDGDIATVGITAYAAEKLGDVVYVDLPKVGATVSAATVVGEIESTKSVGELFAPVAGEVIEINQAVIDQPDLVNADPFGDAWMIKVRFTELPALMTAAEYEALTA